MADIRKPIFVRPLDLGTMICGNALSGHSVEHLNEHKAPGLTWRTDGNSNIWARGEMSAERPIDFCAIVAANAQPGTQVRVRLGMTQAEVDGAAPYDSGAQPFIAPAITREDGLYHSHLELPSIVTARWWRIDITSHTDDFEAGKLVLGRKIEPSRFYNLDFEYGEMDMGDLEFSRWGVFDEAPGVTWRTINFVLSWQTEEEWETKFRPMVEALGRRGIIYCCFDPEPSPYRQARTFMGTFDKPPYARGVRKPRTLEQEFKIVSYI